MSPRQCARCGELFEPNGPRVLLCKACHAAAQQHGNPGHELTCVDKKMADGDLSSHHSRRALAKRENWE